MEDDRYTIEPHIDPNDRQAQRSLIWAISGVFLVMNILIILAGMGSESVAANLNSILDIIFWFDISCAGVIGSFFGVDIVNKLTSRQTITMKKIQN